MKTLTTVKGVWYIGTWMLFCTFHTLNNDYLTAVFTTPIWYRTGKNVYNSRIPIFIFWRTSQDPNIGFRFFLWLQWKRICVVVSMQDVYKVLLLNVQYIKQISTFLIKPKSCQLPVPGMRMFLSKIWIVKV
jgi:hypothetical protein